LTEIKGSYPIIHSAILFLNGNSLEFIFDINSLLEIVFSHFISLAFFLFLAKIGLIVSK